MKKLNFTVAIIYSIFLAFGLMGAIEDEDFYVLLGLIIVAIPVAVNWLTWNHLNKA